MIEFVLSKLWTVLFGLTLIGVLVISFDSLDKESQMQDLRSQMENIVEVLDDLTRLPQGSRLNWSLDDMMREGDMLELEKGFLRISRGDISLSMAHRVPIVFALSVSDQGYVLICMDHRSSILIESAGSPENPYLVIHLAKSSMISLRTFANR